MGGSGYALSHRAAAHSGPKVSSHLALRGTPKRVESPRLAYRASPRARISLDRGPLRKDAVQPFPRLPLLVCRFTQGNEGPRTPVSAIACLECRLCDRICP
jgi:hypothetical protein